MSYRWAGLSTTSTNTTRMSIILTGVSQNHGKYCYGYGYGYGYDESDE